MPIIYTFKYKPEPNMLKILPIVFPALPKKLTIIPLFCSHIINYYPYIILVLMFQVATY